MTNILALEAASEICSVTLHTPNSVKTLEVDEARSHSKHFLPLVQTLLDESGIALDEITFIACGNGPGSFTGLRICFSMAQGLAFGLRIPLLTVSSLESMAHSFKRSGFCRQRRGLSLLDARMDEVYLGEFDLSSESVQRIGEMQLLNLESARGYISELAGNNEGEYALLGPGASLLSLPQELRYKLAIHEQVLPHSSSVAEVAFERWRAGEITTADAAQICYLRNSVSWEKRKRVKDASDNAD